MNGWECSSRVCRESMRRGGRGGCTRCRSVICRDGARRMSPTCRRGKEGLVVCCIVVVCVLEGGAAVVPAGESVFQFFVFVKERDNVNLISISISISVSRVVCMLTHQSTWRFATSTEHGCHFVSIQWVRRQPGGRPESGMWSAFYTDVFWRRQICLLGFALQMSRTYLLCWFHTCDIILHLCVGFFLRAHVLCT